MEYTTRPTPITTEDEKSSGMILIDLTSTPHSTDELTYFGKNNNNRSEKLPLPSEVIILDDSDNDDDDDNVRDMNNDQDNPCHKNIHNTNTNSFMEMYQFQENSLDSYVWIQENDIDGTSCDDDDDDDDVEILFVNKKDNYESGRIANDTSSRSRPFEYVSNSTRTQVDGTGIHATGTTIPNRRLRTISNSTITAATGNTGTIITTRTTTIEQNDSDNFETRMIAAQLMELRRNLERVCRNLIEQYTDTSRKKNKKNKNENQLFHMIEQLRQSRIISLPHAKVMHEIRMLGNAAVHQIEKLPPRQIIENTILRYNQFLNTY